MDCFLRVCSSCGPKLKRKLLNNKVLHKCSLTKEFVRGRGRDIYKILLLTMWLGVLFPTNPPSCPISWFETLWSLTDARVNKFSKSCRYVNVWQETNIRIEFGDWLASEESSINSIKSVAFIDGLLLLALQREGVYGRWDEANSWDNLGGWRVSVGSARSEDIRQARNDSTGWR